MALNTALLITAYRMKYSFPDCGIPPQDPPCLNRSEKLLLVYDMKYSIPDRGILKIFHLIV